MKLVFDGLEASLHIEPGQPVVLQIENQVLFSRIGQSLHSQKGRDSVEPYTLWDENGEVTPKNALLFIQNVFELPWTDSSLLGGVLHRMERDLIDDEDLRVDIEQVERQFAGKLMSLTGCLSADYSLEIEWDLGKHLKMLGFGVDSASGSKLIDNLISFLSLVLDARCSKVLVFVNLKTFLAKSELERFYEHVFYTNTAALLLEHHQDPDDYRYEYKYTIDQDFLEY